MAKKLLITGAGGFIGGYLVQEALNRGFDTWAAVRASTSREYLRDERIHFIELDFSDRAVLEQQLGAAVSEMGGWNYVIHNLGATKCTNFNDFKTINFTYLTELVNTLDKLGAMPQKFLFISSLSAMGEGDEKTYTPITTSMVPAPNTKYGLSKMQAEMFLQRHPSCPYIIFRCTGVYGPHERDYFLMMQSINRGFDFSVGIRKQLLTFIYVKDLAAAAMDALEKSPVRKTYIISEPKAYTQAEFRKIVSNKLGKRFVIPIKAPLWLLHTVCFLSEIWGMIRLKPSTLNRDKYKILRQRNWNCDVSDAVAGFGFNPTHNLEQGVSEAIDWYRENGWL